MDWIDLPQDRDKWQAVLNTINKLKFTLHAGVWLAEKLLATQEELCWMVLETF